MTKFKRYPDDSDNKANWYLWALLAVLSAWTLFELYQEGQWDERDTIQQISDNEKMIVIKREAQKQ